MSDDRIDRDDVNEGSLNGSSLNRLHALVYS